MGENQSFFTVSRDRVYRLALSPNKFQGMNIPEPQQPITTKPSSRPKRGGNKEVGKNKYNPLAAAKPKPSGKAIKDMWDEECASFLVRMRSTVPKARPAGGFDPETAVAVTNKIVKDRIVHSVSVILFTVNISYHLTICRSGDSRSGLAAGRPGKPSSI